MRLATRVLGVALLVLVAYPGVAPADDAAPPSYRAVIDRVDLEPASIGGLRLHVELSALTLQGQLLDLSDPRSIKLMVGGSKLDAPYARGVFGATGADAAIVFVVQANLAYAEVLQTVLASLDDAVLSKLGDRTQVALLAYGEATEAGKLGSLKSARTRIGTVSPDRSTGEPALLDTLDRAMRLLKKARPAREGASLRRMVVVIGDGRDRAGDRDRVTKLGTRARSDGIRIHSLGFAPSNVRRPLLTLGELSKQSLGTFRWVRTGGAESWNPAFQQLRDEINKQYVLTYFLPTGTEVAGKKLRIVTVGRTEALSNELKIPEAACGREACAGYCVDDICAIPHEDTSRGVLGWLVLIVGIALGAAAVLGGIGFVMQRRHHAADPGVAAGVPGQPP
ncbi:MAG TPA: vWA domain-containing protein, partial [Kofleriaceae bacterium]|nr:vWA domain-containing protein [Kofleriaceae bacterium]